MRTHEEEVLWGPRLSDRQIINAKHRTTYGHETPLVNGVSPENRALADGYTFLVAEIIGLSVLDITTRRIALAAMRQALTWKEAHDAEHPEQTPLPSNKPWAESVCDYCGEPVAGGTKLPRG